MQELCRSCVGAVECNEAAIFPQTLESQAKDQKLESQAKDQNQKIAAFGSSYTGEFRRSETGIFVGSWAGFWIHGSHPSALLHGQIAASQAVG